MTEPVAWGGSRSVWLGSRVSGAAIIVGAAVVALVAPPLGLAICIFCAVAIGALSLDASDREPALLGCMAALGLYFSTGLGSIDLPAIVPLSALSFITTGLHRTRSIRSLPWDLRAALVLFLAGLMLGIPRGPMPREGVRTLIILAWLVCIGRLAFVLTLEGRERALFRAYTAAAGVFGIVNFLFFLFPRAEDAYFASWISQVFVEPDSIRKLLTGDVLNNALSDLKAATLYINANVAAMFFGTAAWASYGWWRGSPFAWPLSVACTLGALGTVSRGGALGGAASLTVWALLQVRRDSLARIGMRVGTGAVVMGAVAAVLAWTRADSLSRFAWSTVAADPRFLLWGAALSLGSKHPILGSGFGAWERYWPSIASVVNLRGSFPPHNVYLYLWIIGGVLAATGFLWIAVAVLRAVRRTLSLNTSRVFPEALAAGAIVAWCWVQANFENFFFLDYRIGFLLAATFGWVAARLASPTTQ